MVVFTVDDRENLLLQGDILRFFSCMDEDVSL